MATTAQFQERLRRAVREALQKVLAEGDLPKAVAGEARFTTIETRALAAGDAVSLEVFEQQLAESGMGPPHCPRCGFQGRHVGPRERTLQTRRGLDVPLSEPECYCPGCRRAFFPAFPNSGPGRGLGLQSDGLKEGRVCGHAGEEFFARRARSERTCRTGLFSRTYASHHGADWHGARGGT